MPLKFSSKLASSADLNFTYPSCIEDLCIHKKKLAQICDFFNFAHKRTPILLLTGPAGCAKSTAIRIIARQFGFTLTEWDNSNMAGSEFDLRRDGIFQQFESFLLSAFRSTYRKDHFLFVEEYPIIFDSVAMRIKFTKLLSQLLELAEGNLKPIPIVFLWSESNECSRETSDIFSKTFKSSPSVLHIR